MDGGEIHFTPPNKKPLLVRFSRGQQRMASVISQVLRTDIATIHNRFPEEPTGEQNTCFFSKCKDKDVEFLEWSAGSQDYFHTLSWLPANWFGSVWWIGGVPPSTRTFEDQEFKNPQATNPNQRKKGCLIKRSVSCEGSWEP